MRSTLTSVQRLPNFLYFPVDLSVSFSLLVFLLFIGGRYCIFQQFDRSWATVSKSLARLLTARLPLVITCFRVSEDALESVPILNNTDACSCTYVAFRSAELFFGCDLLRKMVGRHSVRWLAGAVYDG